METIQAPAAIPVAELPRPRRLLCSCCGAETRGRQHWNRDTGYGVCMPCVEWMTRRGTDPEELARNYGTRGVHYDITEAG